MEADKPATKESTSHLQTTHQSCGRDWGVAALDTSRERRRALQRRFATTRQRWIDANRYYYQQIERLLRFVIEPNRRVLHVRSQTGDLLSAVAPSQGVGLEISSEMAAIATARHPEFTFHVADPERLEVNGKFDYILFSDLFDTVDVLAALKRLTPACEPHTRLVIYNYNRLWDGVLNWASRVGLRMPAEEPNWLSEDDMRVLLKLADFEELRVFRVVLFPKWIPLVSEFLNRVVARLPGLSRLCMIYVMVARPRVAARRSAEVTVSVIVPCRNEAGNVTAAVERIPSMGRHTEILFCDDQSTDGTADVVRRMQVAHPEKHIRLIDGPGINKAENVRTGFRAATGDVVLILDGDLAVMPEELPYFVAALVEGHGEFVNGSRLVYPMPRAAMKMTNTFGNKLFSMLFSYVLGLPIKDTLCGTKAMWRGDWQRIDRIWGTWGVKDRWGDYELIFGAAKLQLCIVDMPVHYQERVYGVTKMNRVFWNGIHMLRMCGAAWIKLKGGY
jgi:hypothetical protein